jgi:hypothetical protein
METILLNGEIILYKTSYISNTKQKDLIKILEKEIEKQPLVINEAFSISLKTEGVDDIIEFGVKCCTELFKNSGLVYNERWADIWINRIKNETTYQKVVTNPEDAIYHIHTELSNDLKKFKPNYTFVYYVQMPDNLIENEGALLIKNSKGDIYTYHPKEFDFIIMDADVPHSPMASPNSTKDRLVVAGNIGFLNTKTERSIL